MYPPSRSLHTPLFWHGLEAHSFISNSQCGPRDKIQKLHWLWCAVIQIKATPIPIHCNCMEKNEHCIIQMRRQSVRKWILLWNICKLNKSEHYKWHYIRMLSCSRGEMLTCETIWTTTCKVIDLIHTEAFVPTRRWAALIHLGLTQQTFQRHKCINTCRLKNAKKKQFNPGQPHTSSWQGWKNVVRF